MSHTRLFASRLVEIAFFSGGVFFRHMGSPRPYQTSVFDCFWGYKRKKSASEMDIVDLAGNGSNTVPMSSARRIWMMIQSDSVFLGQPIPGLVQKISKGKCTGIPLRLFCI